MEDKKHKKLNLTNTPHTLNFIVFTNEPFVMVTRLDC